MLYEVITIAECFTPVAEKDHPDKPVRGYTRFFAYRASRSTSPALVTGKQILARLVHDFPKEGLSTFCFIF